MATAVSSAVAPPLGSDQAPQPPSVSPALASIQQRATPNGSVTPVNDGVIHPGLRLDMRNANGAQRDGRVRNPIPSKLKGKTDEKKGNFNVMHMDISNASESQARYDAAKRSSESTALQAKMAETDHYVSHHRRANYARSKSQKDEEPPAPPPPPPPPRGRILGSEEVKAEQARLLTLLRTLPHANIVDQICKALAFFGGIPDAPPPVDGKFPESGEANGAGSLFVGWLSEIFPDLDRPRRPVVQLSAPPKRPRGRPKGSKATKARRDKGVKKGSKDGVTGLGGDQDGDDEGWEDMNDSIVDTNRPDESVEDRVLSLLQTPPPPNVAAPQATPATGGSSGFTSINPAAADSTSASKKRGRPKGSKNKQKAAEAEAQGIPQQGQQALIQAPPVQAPTTTAIFQPPPISTIPVPEASPATTKKTAGGRSKGGKKKATNLPTQQTAAPQVGTSTSYIPPPTLPLAATRPAAAVPAQVVTNDSITTAKRTQLPNQNQTPNTTQVPEPLQATPQVRESTIIGVKRKRQSAKPAGKVTIIDRAVDSSRTELNIPQAGPSVTPALSSGNVVQSPNAGNSTSVPETTTAPAPKRPRKSNAAASKRKGTVATSQDSSFATTAADALANQQPTQERNSSIPARQPEGLAAHYERFASLQNNSDQSRSYGSQQQQAPATTVNTSSAPAEGLEAHYERFQALQNRQNAVQQNATSRQQTRQVQQQVNQSVSPAPPPVSKTPQVATLPSQQQTRAATNTPNYYTQSSTPAFTVQQGSYPGNQRQSQTSTSSPGTALVSHVVQSPQYATQNNNSPLLGTDNNFRASPSLGFAPRRTPSASPMDNTYRTNSVTSQSFANTRQTPSTSHPGVASGFPSFTDNSLFDLQGFDSTNGNNLALGSAGSYNMGNGNVQRANGASNNGAAYAASAMANGAYDQGGLNKGAMNTDYRGQARWS